MGVFDAGSRHGGFITVGSLSKTSVSKSGKIELTDEGEDIVDQALFWAAGVFGAEIALESFGSSSH